MASSHQPSRSRSNSFHLSFMAGLLRGLSPLFSVFPLIVNARKIRKIVWEVPVRWFIISARDFDYSGSPGSTHLPGGVTTSHIPLREHAEYRNTLLRPL